MIKEMDIRKLVKYLIVRNLHYEIGLKDTKLLKILQEEIVKRYLNLYKYISNRDTVLNYLQTIYTDPTYHVVEFDPARLVQEGKLKMDEVSKILGIQIVLQPPPNITGGHTKNKTKRRRVKLSKTYKRKSSS
jgi:hypothetical protein